MKLISGEQLLARSGTSLYLFVGLALLGVEAGVALGIVRDWSSFAVLVAAVFALVWLVILAFGSRGQGWVLRLSVWLWCASLAYLFGVSLIDILANPDLNGSGRFTLLDIWPIAKLLALSPGYIGLQLYGELPIYIDIASFLELQADASGLVWLQIWTLSLLHYSLLLLIIWCDNRAYMRFSERLDNLPDSPYLPSTRRRPLDDME